MSKTRVGRWPELFHKSHALLHSLGALEELQNYVNWAYTELNDLEVKIHVHLLLAVINHHLSLLQRFLQNNDDTAFDCEILIKELISKGAPVKRAEEQAAEEPYSARALQNCLYSRGSHQLSLARSVCRRMERHIAALEFSSNFELVQRAQLVRPYVNRLDHVFRFLLDSCIIFITPQE